MWTFAPPPPPVVRSLTLYDADGGVHQASITCTPWDARARLRYSDLTSADVYDRDPITGQSYIRMATVTLLAVSVTVTAAEGFPPVTVKRGTPDEAVETFDPTRVDHLLALPADVLAEVRRHALDVQPLPTARRAEPALAEPTLADPQEEGDEDEDPTPTPSTPRAPSSASRSDKAPGRKRSATSTRRS